MENQNPQPANQAPIQYRDPNIPIIKHERHLPLPSFGWIAFIIANIAIPLIFGAIYLNVIKNDKPDITTQTNSRTPATPTPSPAVEPITEWKTYEDDILSFKYPPTEKVELKDKAVSTMSNQPFGSILTYDEKYLINTKELQKCSEVDEESEEDGYSCLGGENALGSLPETIEAVNIGGVDGEEFHVSYYPRAFSEHLIQLKNPAIIFYANHPVFKLIEPTIKFTQ